MPSKTAGTTGAESVSSIRAAPRGDSLPSLSIVVPVYNEEDNIEPLFEGLCRVLDEFGHRFEVVAVNDGSTDNSLERLLAEAREQLEIKVIDLRWNTGQTAALMAGFDHASGDIIIPMDADLQNDPSDIPHDRKTGRGV